MSSMREKLEEVDAALAALGAGDEEASGIRASYSSTTSGVESDEILAALARDVADFKKRLASVEYPSRAEIERLSSMPPVSEASVHQFKRGKTEEDFEMLADDDILEIVDEDPGDDLEISTSTRPPSAEGDAEPKGLFKRLFRNKK